MDWNEALRGLLTALALGLLIGIVRERAHPTAVAQAGTRTHALVALLGAVAWGLGTAAFVATLLAVGALAVVGYLKTADSDPGMTGEVAIVLTCVLGGLARDQRVMASALGVLVAILLYAKKPLQRLTRELISDHELEDALMLAAAAVVVWPLLPQEPLDPWGVLDLHMVWRLVVLVMVVGMMGHVAQRVVGARVGVPLAGFFSGFVSSTLAVASFGSQVKQSSTLTSVASAGALLANLASLLLMAAILAAAAPGLMLDMLWPLLSGAVVLMAAALLCLLRDGRHAILPEMVKARSFKLTHALSIALIIAVVIVLTAWLRELLGEAGALVTAGLVALVELQAAAASIAQLNSAGALESRVAQWGVLIVLAAASVAKTVLAFVSGGARYGLYVGGGLMLMVAMTLMVMLL
jgi:uncharacterized membrane protein (DUF4010 family)